MFKVLYALAPITLFSVFLFGWRVLVLLSVTNLFSFLTEYLFLRKSKKKVSSAVFVTGTLLALIVPPTLPFWMAAIGSIVAVLFGKCVFGGFGMNVFNPAMVGRTFLYLTFANNMTVNWVSPFKSLPGGFAAYMNVKAITQATAIGGSLDYTLKDAFFGLMPGSVGETSALLILLAAVYLIFTKSAKWQTMLSTLIGFTLFTAIFYGVGQIISHLLIGGVLFGTVFMITDPISSPRNKYAIWINGLLVGFLTVFIRKFALWSEGFMFALLISNSVMPLIDYGLNSIKK